MSVDALRRAITPLFSMSVAALITAGGALTLPPAATWALADTQARRSGEGEAMLQAETDLTALRMDDIIARLADGRVTSEALVEAYLARIAALDRRADGLALNSVLTLNPDAAAIARERDRDRALGLIRGPLHGVPILIKDNIETADPIPTTAGSTALAANENGRDAPVVAGLRAAGAIILGKTNLSQWANFRSTESISGWSALGGQVRNPYALSRSPCGSSSGSGVAARMGFAAGTVGTETNGSIMCPSSMNGIVGVKPTVGLVPRTHIVPISSSQDTAGPMTRSVTGAAHMLTAMAGSDPEDPATAEAGLHATDYAAALTGKGLEGKRVGVLRFALSEDPRLAAVFEGALETVKAAGAETVDIEEFDVPDSFWGQAFTVLRAEFKATVNAYLATTGDGVTARSLEALIAHNAAHGERELALFDQDIFEQSLEAPSLNEAAYVEARNTIRRLSRQEGVLRLMKEHDVDLLIAPSRPPSFMIDVVHGDQYPGGVGADWLAAIAGTPNVTVPMGMIKGLPVGLSFMGAPWSEALLLDAAYTFEQGHEPIPAPTLAPTLHGLPGIAGAVDPR